MPISLGARAVAHLLSHSVAGRPGQRVLVWLFPAREERFLSPREMASFLPSVRQFQRNARLLYVAGTLGVMAILTFFLGSLDEKLQVPIADPVWINRGGLGMLAPAFLLALPSGFWLARLRAWRYWGPDLELYDRFEETLSGIDDRRCRRTISALFVAVAVPFGILLWHAGEAVGENGIVFKNGFRAAQHKRFDEVASIGRYTKFRAPIGIVDFANLYLTFKDGESLRIRKAKGQEDAPQLDAVAEYISRRSHVSIVWGDVSPE